MKPLIRTATPDDFPTLVAIDQSCFEENIAYDAYELKYFMSRRGATTLVAEINGTIAGFLLMDVEHERKRAVLVTLDLLASYRRQGIGSQLLARSESVLTGANIPLYELQVDTSNSVAIHFYKEHGFHTVRTLQNYYTNGADAYLMEREIGMGTDL